jgi:hypothetical protein
MDRTIWIKNLQGQLEKSRTQQRYNRTKKRNDFQ